MKRNWSVIIMTLAVLAVLAGIALLSGCIPSDGKSAYTYTCKVDRVEGTFVTARIHIKSSSRMVTMYRFTNDKKRTFMFPAERIQCEKNN